MPILEFLLPLSFSLSLSLSLYLSLSPSPLIPHPPIRGGFFGKRTALSIDMRLGWASFICNRAAASKSSAPNCLQAIIFCGPNNQHRRQQQQQQHSINSTSERQIWCYRQKMALRCVVHGRGYVRWDVPALPLSRKQ